MLISCGSDQCKLLETTSCSDNLCKYSYGYTSGVLTLGFLATETISFTYDYGELVPFQNIVFDCGHNNTEGFAPSEMGLIGTNPTITSSNLASKLKCPVMKQYEDPSLGTQLCYQSSNLANISAPPPLLTAHFKGGAEVHLVSTSTFISPKQGVLFCNDTY
ncbi:hypothetical protein ACFE04_007292 [Oxalis oulophora]